jgi:predicted AAA+ superfamily ATPase
MTYIARSIEPYLRDKLGRGRAIVIYGPRRSGKTTLAKRLLETYNKGGIAEYQTDDPKQAALFTADGEALRRLVAGKKAVFIDEAQAIENAGLVMKLLVDRFPEVQVIATGSSSFELSDKLKESMVAECIR